MYVVIGLVQGVLVAGGTDIPLSIEVNFSLAGHQHPHANIELPAMVQQRPLYVLLHDPQGVSRLRPQKLRDLVQLAKYFDAAPLVEIRRLHQPQVFLAVFGRHLTIATAIPSIE